MLARLTVALEVLYAASLVGAMVAGVVTVGIGGDGALTALEAFLAAALGSLTTLHLIAALERRNAAFAAYLEEGDRC